MTISKSKTLNALVLISSLFGYLEWGTDNSTFLFEAEYEVLTKLSTDPMSAAHPFTIIPLLGQALLLMTLFQSTPGKILTYVGITCIGLLLVLIFIIGLIGFEIKTMASAIPFIVLSIAAIRNVRKS